MAAAQPKLSRCRRGSSRGLKLQQGLQGFLCCPWIRRTTKQQHLLPAPLLNSLWGVCPGQVRWLGHRDNGRAFPGTAMLLRVGASRSPETRKKNNCVFILLKYDNNSAARVVRVLQTAHKWFCRSKFGFLLLSWSDWVALAVSEMLTAEQEISLLPLHWFIDNPLKWTGNISRNRKFLRKEMKNGLPQLLMAQCEK